MELKYKLERLLKRSSILPDTTEGLGIILVLTLATAHLGTSTVLSASHYSTEKAESFNFTLSNGSENRSIMCQTPAEEFRTDFVAYNCEYNPWKLNTTRLAEEHLLKFRWSHQEQNYTMVTHGKMKTKNIREDELIIGGYNFHDKLLGEDFYFLAPSNPGFYSLEVETIDGFSSSLQSKEVSKVYSSNEIRSLLRAKTNLMFNLLLLLTAWITGLSLVHKLNNDSRFSRNLVNRKLGLSLILFSIGLIALGIGLSLGEPDPLTSVFGTAALLISLSLILAQVWRL